MLIQCTCGSTISISTILFSTLSLSDLENLCYDYDYTTYSNSPFYDSVLENGEYDKKKEANYDESDEDDPVDESYDIPDNYYEE